MNVVVGVNEEQRSRNALRRAADEAIAHGGVLHAVYVYPPPAADIAADPAALIESRASSGQEAREEHARSAATQKLADIVQQELGQTPPNTRLVVVSDHDAGEALLERAADADLLVIGLRRRSRVGKFILGSTAQDVLLKANCPVLTVPDDAAPDD